jgi:hypothetical protein
VANKPKTNYKGDVEKINKVDICQSPPHSIEPLLPLLDEDWTIWESAVGPEKILRKTLCRHGYNVIGTDLLYGTEFNYFTFNPEFHYDVELTNIPFSIKYKWIQRAFERGKRFAFICPYETTASATFQKLAATYHNRPYTIEVLVPERRINFKMPNVGWGKEVWSEEKGFYHSGGSAQMPVIWLTWGLNAKTHYPMYIDTYAVPMRNVKYDENNQEIKKG